MLREMSFNVELKSKILFYFTIYKAVSECYSKGTVVKLNRILLLTFVVTFFFLSTTHLLRH